MDMGIVFEIAPEGVQRGKDARQHAAIPCHLLHRIGGQRAELTQ